MALAVMATIGVRRPGRSPARGCAAVASRPSISGICTSISTRSYSRRATRSSASRPSLATSTPWPQLLEHRAAPRFWLTGLSSATRTRRARPSAGWPRRGAFARCRPGRARRQRACADRRRSSCDCADRLGQRGDRDARRRVGLVAPGPARRQQHQRQPGQRGLGRSPRQREPVHLRHAAASSERQVERLAAPAAVRSAPPRPRRRRIGGRPPCPTPQARRGSVAVGRVVVDDEDAPTSSERRGSCRRLGSGADHAHRAVEPERAARGRARSHARSRRPSARPAGARSPAQPGAAVLARGRAVGLRERLEQRAALLAARCRCRCRVTSKRSDAAARRRRVAPGARGRTTSPRVGELDRVADQVDEHLAQPAAGRRDQRAGTSGSIAHGQLEALLRAAARRSSSPTSSTQRRGGRSRRARARACPPRSSRSRGCR